MHELSEATRRVIDTVAAVMFGVAATLTLANIALVVSIVAGLLSISWHITRYYGLYRGRQEAE